MRMSVVAVVAAALLAVVSAILCKPVVAHNYAAPAYYLAGLTDESDKFPQFPPTHDEELARLIKQSTNMNEYVRFVAVGALGQTGHPEALDPIIRALKDSSPQVRSAAALSLSVLRDDRAIEPLIAATKESDVYSRPPLATALWVLGKPAMKALLAQLDSVANDDEAQAIVAAIDSEMLDPETVLSPRALNVMSRLLKPQYFETQMDAATMLMRVNDPRAKALLFEQLSHADNDDSGRPAAWHLSGVKDKATIDKLIASASDINCKFRQWAILALRNCTDPRAADVIVSALKSGKPVLQMPAAEAAQGNTDARVVPALIAASKSKDAYVSSSALGALVRSSDPRAVERVTAAAGTGNQYVQQAIVWAIGESQNPKYLDLLIKMLRDGKSQELATIIRTIGEFKDKRATKPLLAAADKQRRWLPNVVEALRKIWDPLCIKPMVSALGTAAPEDAVGWEIVSLLAGFGKQAVSSLVAALKSPNPRIRLGAARVLSITMDSRSVAALIKTAGDGNAHVRKAAIAALGVQGDKTATPVLMRALKDTDAGVRSAAACALADVGTATSANRIAVLLKDRDGFVRMSAGVSLGMLGDKRGASQLVRALGSTEEWDSKYREDWTGIRIRAIRAAGVLKDRRAVTPIMLSLGEDCRMSVFDGPSDRELERSRSTKLQALKDITRKDFGQAYYRWMAWWEHESGGELSRKWRSTTERLPAESR